MKKFIINVLIFIGLLLIINLACKYILNDIYFNEYYKVNLDSKIYLLADSHGASLGDFNRKDIYNFSEGSDSYYDMKHKLNFLIKYSNIQTVILTADSHTLSPYRDNSNNLDRSHYFTSQEDFLHFFDFVKEKYFFQTFVLLDSRYGNILKRYLVSLIKSPPLNSQNSWNEMTNKVKIKNSVDRFEKQFSYENSSKGLEIELLEIIKISRNNGIKLIGVKFPLANQYDSIVKNKNYNADSILVSNKIPILDLNKNKIYGDEYFMDQDHLNKTGAKEFKQILFDSIRNVKF